MPLKILLQLGEEEVMTLDKAYNFSPRQKEQLTSFNVGWGMLVKDGGEHWPINWRGARCGLGLGDEHWRDRYAVAWVRTCSRVAGVAGSANTKTKTRT